MWVTAASLYARPWAHYVRFFTVPSRSMSRSESTLALAPLAPEVSPAMHGADRLIPSARPVNCQALYTINQIFGNATIGLASINLSLRT